MCFAAADNGGVAVLDPAKVAGKIVLCDRGVNARHALDLERQAAREHEQGGLGGGVGGAARRGRGGGRSSRPWRAVTHS